MSNSWSCSACGKTFLGLGGFDAHRTGKYTGDAYPYGRRCLTDDELNTKGYLQKPDDPRWRKKQTAEKQVRLERMRG